MPYKDPEVARQKGKERREKNREEAKQRSKEWYKANKKYALDRQQQYYKKHKEERLAYQKEWRHTESGRVSRRKSWNKDYKKNHDQYLCRDRFKKAVAKGWLVRKPCARCGDVNSQGHHEDYSKPYEVRWLCDRHHKEIEGKLLD